MSRTSNVVWSVIGLAAAIIAVLGAVYGPKMYREGKALVGPIVDIAQSEERLADLNAGMSFEEPADGVVTEDRLRVFLDIRRELLPRYKQWQDIERELKKHGQEDWESAMEALTAIQGVMAVQIDTLESHGMSPAEFVWLEDLAYETWATQAELQIESSAITETIRQTTVGDMENLAELEKRFGTSRTTKEFAARLEQRLRALDNPEPPMIEGVSDAASALFWTHREELADLDLSQYSELHGVVRGGNSVNITIDGEGEED